MSDQPQTDPSSLPVAVVQQIDEVRDRFEGAWKGGQEARIEDYLGQWPEPGRSALFYRLLWFEVDYRTRSGNCPGQDEYRSRFPEHTDLVDFVFQSQQGAPALADTLPLGELGTGDYNIDSRN